MAPSELSSGGTRVLELGFNHLDDKTRGALEAFEKAIRPVGLAASAGDSGEKVRARAKELLDKDCRGLVSAGEALLNSVGKVGECPMMVLVQKLPRLLARQALMIALSNVMPELLDGESRRMQVDELQKRQLSSTTRYLQELGTVRSHLRNVTAAENHTSQAAGESGKGSFASTVTSMRQAATVTTALTSALKKTRGGDSSRRPSISEKEADILETQVSTDDDHELRPSMSITSNPSTRKGRRSLTVSGAAAAALAAKRTVRQPSVDGGIAPDVGSEFGDVHHYMWDAVEHLDKGLQVIVCKVIAEKMQCFKTQKEATVLAELSALCRRMESFLQGTSVEDQEKQMQEAQAKLEAKDAEILRLCERLQQSMEQAAEKEGSMLKTLEQQERVRHSIQRELVEAQANLRTFQQKYQELSQELAQAKEAEAAAQKERSQLQRARVQLLRPGGKTDPTHPNLQDFFHKFLPGLSQHLVKELRDPSVNQHFTPIIEHLQREWAADLEKHEKMASRLKVAEKELAQASSHLQELETRSAEFKEAAEGQILALRQRAERAEQDMVQLQSGVLDKIHKAPAFVSLREEYEILKCELEESTKQLEVLRTALSRKDEDKAHLQGLLEEKEAQVLKLQEEVQEVAGSQLHPSKVAQLCAELKQVKHECQALTNSNNFLRSAVETLQQKLAEQMEGHDHEEAALIRETCSRSVFSRLYEDAVSRDTSLTPRLRHAESWAGGTENGGVQRPHSAGVLGKRRRKVDPPRSRSAPSMLRQLIMENASNLRKTLDEPLFAHDIRLPISPLSPASRRTFPVRSSPSDVPYCGSITPVSHDFAELSSVAAEVVSVVGSRRTMRRLNTAHSRPPSAKSWRTPRSAASGSDARRCAPSRFGSSSPLGTSPRTSAADAKPADKGSSAAEGKT
eukprot:CAMPEP_0181460586 /NCGR_PEP_ID=MMETSP1110-20121109/33421_1 /TAXON_ID=174948 /ORGANISM="Symbiodinium sp., Strain CCMP421" /LENGTH=910 /DNA_ID=CAMNT_0023585149 /DNA_START=30 /DNA_END=2758 /DNA_ORIENTATION=+